MRRWSDLGVSAQSALITLFTFCGGALLYAAGLYPLSARAADPSLTVRFGVLALLCAATYFRRIAPMVAIVGALIPVGIDLALGPTVPIWLIYSDLIYAAVLYGNRQQSRGVVIAQQ